MLRRRWQGNLKMSTTRHGVRRATLGLDVPWSRVDHAWFEVTAFVPMAYERSGKWEKVGRLWGSFDCQLPMMFAGDDPLQSLGLVTNKQDFLALRWAFQTRGHAFPVFVQHRRTGLLRRYGRDIAIRVGRETALIKEAGGTFAVEIVERETNAELQRSQLG
jgi:hypothetical protein